MTHNDVDRLIYIGDACGVSILCGELAEIDIPCDNQGQAAHSVISAGDRARRFICWRKRVLPTCRLPRVGQLLHRPDYCRSECIRRTRSPLLGYRKSERLTSG
jgi:hypothetical protein